MVRIKAQQRVGELVQILRKIEAAAGRDRSKPKFSPRTLDIDILLVDDLVGNIDGVKLPREEILENAFVLLPLSDIATHEVHPERGETFAQLWEEFDKTKQKLWKLPGSTGEILTAID